METSNELVSGAALVFEGTRWCKLSTTVRCGGKEALAFLMRADSRSLMSECDVENSKVSERSKRALMKKRNIYEPLLN